MRWIAGGAGDPEAALHNLLERDRMFTERLRARVRLLDLPFVDVDGACTGRDLTVMVADRPGMRD